MLFIPSSCRGGTSIILCNWDIPGCPVVGLGGIKLVDVSVYVMRWVEEAYPGVPPASITIHFLSSAFEGDGTVPLPLADVLVARGAP